MPSASAALLPLITDNKRTTRAWEIVQQVDGNIRALVSGGAPSRGNCAGGRASGRTQAFQKRSRRVEGEAQQVRLQLQEIRRD